MTDLERLLRPKTIAVVGGGAWCEAVIAQNQKIGFSGEIWPVHQKKDTVAGLTAFRSLADLPAAPDATFIGVNRNATITLVGELHELGAGGAVCFASGFKETDDGQVLNDQLLAAAGDMPILGPNCYGVLNAVDQVALWPDQHGLSPVETGVAILTQSSNIAINLTMQKRGLPITYVITAGNQAQQGLAHIAQTVIRDERVTALGLYIESFGDVLAFEELARLSQELNKPIVALKVGRSTESQIATISHTASLAGSSAGSDALLARLGIASVASPVALLETLKILHCHGPLSGRRIASLSCSGGEASVMADTAAEFGVTFPPLQPHQATALDKHLSSLVHLANPLDYHTQIWRDKAAMTAVYAAMTGDDIDLTVIVLDFPRLDICEADEWMIAIEAIEDAAQQTGRPFAVLASIAENLPETIAKRLFAAGIVPLCDFGTSCEAISAAAAVGAGAHSPLLTAPIFDATTAQSEGDAKRALAGYGLDIPQSAGGLALSALTEQAEKIGFPLVLKGEGIAHKTEAGAVVLNIMDNDQLLRAAQAMPTTSFLVEEMITSTIAELLIGVVADPAHGFVLTLAAGGTLTELLDDRQSLLLPTTDGDIRRALAKLKINTLLTGFRGAAPANLDAIVDAVLRLQTYVIAHADQIAEIEINPLICTKDRAIIADTLLVKGTS
ncbi:CoA-binding protein [Loktanella sp. D2R18]|uniref:acetate--CoA ligase family protein n=1 Tax=Rhodobacterales TaxID=204455 RepID=UPI000DE93207|nr:MULTISPECIES: acetate--CoA ligase family protein [Rhodobacterales]MDO6589403.1 acetate--CoA ligase family protein [Yoonia sp. 1_MG-2023]RBW45189.1 CoA-binding protein [Loktanella sp. D2R18]